jgi:hypothetical protein
MPAPSDLSPTAPLALAQQLLRAAAALLDPSEPKPTPAPTPPPPARRPSAPPVAPPVAPPPRDVQGRRHGLDRRAADLAAVPGDDDDLLKTRETARWLSVSEQWLEIGRSKGWGPPFIRLSPRRVRYRRGTVRTYLIERAHAATSEYDTRNRDGSPVGRKPGSKVVDGKVVEPGEASP